MQHLRKSWRFAAILIVIIFTNQNMWSIRLTRNDVYLVGFVPSSGSIEVLFFFTCSYIIIEAGIDMTLIYHSYHEPLLQVSLILTALLTGPQLFSFMACHTVLFTLPPSHKPIYALTIQQLTTSHMLNCIIYTVM